MYGKYYSSRHVACFRVGIGEGLRGLVRDSEGGLVYRKVDGLN